MIELLIAAIVLGLIYYCVTLLPLPDPFRMIVTVIFIIIAIIYLLKFLPGGSIL